MKENLITARIMAVKNISRRTERKNVPHKRKAGAKKIKTSNGIKKC